MSETKVIEVMRLPHGDGLPLPACQTPLSAGYDLLAAVPQTSPVTLAPGAWTAVPTGLALALPAGVEGQVRPRSGLALRHGVTVLNAPGTIDADYRGEVLVLLVNLGKEPFIIERGARIAQLVLGRFMAAEFVETVRLSQTERGAGGFGSTGQGVGI